MPNPVVHWEIAVKNFDKAKAFYSGLFGWKVDSNNPMNYGIVDTAAGGINGGIFQAQKNMPQNYVTFYIQVDDLQKYLTKAESLGGKTCVPPTPIPNMGAFAMFNDPEGNMIGLFKG